MSNELIDTLIDEVDGAMVEAGSDDDFTKTDSDPQIYSTKFHES